MFVPMLALQQINADKLYSWNLAVRTKCWSINKRE